MDDATQTQESPQAPTVETLQEQLEALRAENETLKNERSQLTSRLDRLEAALIEVGLRGRQGVADDTREEPAPRRPAEHEQEPDFDTMSARDMVRYVLGQFDEKLSKAEERVNQQIQRVITETQAARLVDEVSAIIAEYGEDVVTRHQKSIIALMAKNPELSVEEALVLAARRAGEDLTPKNAKKPTTGAGSPGTEEGLPPRGTARPIARKEAPPTSFAEAGQRAWKQLGLKF